MRRGERARTRKKRGPELDERGGWPKLERDKERDRAETSRWKKERVETQKRSLGKKEARLEGRDTRLRGR